MFGVPTPMGDNVQSVPIPNRCVHGKEIRLCAFVTGSCEIDSCGCWGSYSSSCPFRSPGLKNRGPVATNATEKEKCKRREEELKAREIDLP